MSKPNRSIHYHGRRQLEAVLTCLIALAATATNSSCAEQLPRPLLVLLGHQDQVYCLAFSPNGRQLVSGSQDKTCRLWNLAPQQNQSLDQHPISNLLADLDSDRFLVRDEAFSRLAPLAGHILPRLEAINTTTRSAELHERIGRLIEIGNLRFVRKSKTVKSASVVTFASFSPTEPYLVFGAAGSPITAWDLKKNKTIAIGKDVCRCALFLPNGRLAVCYDEAIQLWNLAEQRVEQTISHKGHTCEAMAVSPDGDRLAVATGDSSIHVWSLADLRPLPGLRGHHSVPLAITFAADSRTLISGSGSPNSRLNIWDTDKGRAKAFLKGHPGSIYSVAVTTKGRTAITGCADGVIRLWDIDTGLCKGEFAGDSTAVNCVIVSPDGKRLASAGSDGKIRIWDLERLRGRE